LGETVGEKPIPGRPHTPPFPPAHRPSRNVPPQSLAPPCLSLMPASPLATNLAAALPPRHPAPAAGSTVRPRSPPPAATPLRSLPRQSPWRVSWPFRQIAAPSSGAPFGRCVRCRSCAACPHHRPRPRGAEAEAAAAARRPCWAGH
jgi:hypothetical protein